MYVCLFCWFLLAAWQPQSLVLPQPSVPASRANKTMTFLCFCKKTCLFCTEHPFQCCNFLNNSPVYTLPLHKLRSIVHVYCFPWPRVQLSFVHTTCTYKGMLVRTISWSETVVRTSINFVRAKQIFLFVQSSCTCNCTCKGFSFYWGADTCTAHFCDGRFSRIWV